MKYLILIAMLGMTACSDAEWRKAGNYVTNGDASIVCYSGGKEIYNGQSSGKPMSEQGSDGYYFEDKATGKLMEVSGDCVITYI